MSNVNYKYNIGDTVQFKNDFHSSASCALKALAGKIVTIVDRRCYEKPCYKFEGLEKEGWFTEGTFTEITSNPYVIFVGTSRDDLEPVEAVPDRKSAIAAAIKLQDQYPFVEATFMPEDDEDINEVIYLYYTEED